MGKETADLLCHIQCNTCIPVHWRSLVNLTAISKGIAPELSSVSSNFLEQK